MTSPSFSAILDRPSDSIEKPKPLPVGTYLFSIKGQPEMVKAKSGTEGVKFACIPLQAGEDVDSQALAEALTNQTTKETKPLSAKAINHTDEEIENLAQLVNQRTAWEVLGRKGVKDGQGYMEERPPTEHPAMQMK